MGLREDFTEGLKASMRAGDAARTSTLRLILARLKDTDIAARPQGGGPVADEAIVAMLRGMVKSRAESAALYEQGGRPELAAKERAEIAVIEGFLPAAPSGETIEAAIGEAIAATGAASVKDAGRVMAALKARFGGSVDLGQVGARVRERLSGAA